MSGQSEELGSVLLTIAREAVAEVLSSSPPSLLAATARPELAEPGASFVSVRLAGELNGCIGSLRPSRPLFDDLRANATAAAFDDPRFRPLEVAQLESARFEVSLLSPLEPLVAEGRSSLLDQLRVGVDGLVIERGAQRGTFLPQVWQSLADPGSFLSQLERKAGFEWRPTDRAWRYTVRKWSENETGR